MKSTDKANTRNLMIHCFTILKQLSIKAIEPEEAKEHANLIKQANNLLKYELDRAKALQKFEDLQIREIEEIEESK